MFSKKVEAKKMNVGLEYSKTLAGEGSILLLLSLVPYAGWVLGIIGVVLLLRGMKELSNYYQDEEIYKNALTGVKYYIIAIIAVGVSVAAFTIGLWSATGFVFTTGSFVPTVTFGVGLIAFLGGLIVAFIFYILATSHLKRTFDILAQKSGEASFTTAGNLLWWGALLSIILVGLILIFIAWIFATIGFFTMKPQQPQQSYNPQQYTPTSSSTQSEQGKANESKGINNNYQQSETQRKRGI
jgi:uncharacterized membrane protein